MRSEKEFGNDLQSRMLDVQENLQEVFVRQAWEAADFGWESVEIAPPAALPEPRPALRLVA